MIRDTASELLDRLGMADRDLRVDVDEASPIARVPASASVEPIVVLAESGGFEDTRRPRYAERAAVAANLGRVLLRVRDREDGGFADAPDDDELSLRQTAAWDTYCVGRLERLGYPANRQRWRYNFRNRHGFSDIADAAFERLWDADSLTWGELEAISAEAEAASSRRNRTPGPEGQEVVSQGTRSREKWAFSLTQTSVTTAEPLGSGRSRPRVAEPFRRLGPGAAGLGVDDARHPSAAGGEHLAGARHPLVGEQGHRRATRSGGKASL